MKPVTKDEIICELKQIHKEYGDSGALFHAEEIEKYGIAHSDEVINLIDSLVETIKHAINSGDWKVDGACDPDIYIIAAERIIAKARSQA